MKTICLFIFLILSVSGISQFTPTSKKALYEKTNPSVCRVIYEKSEGLQYSVGTGFLLENDLIVTAKHVHFDTTKTFYVEFPNKLRRKVLDYWSSDKHDVTFFKVEPIKNVRPLVMAKENPARFDDVMLIGNPLILNAWPSTGEVLGIVDFPAPIDDIDESYIGISASAYGGNSGGPAVDTKGQVIGICFFVLLTEGVFPQENLAFLTSTKTIQKELKEFKSKKLW